MSPRPDLHPDGVTTTHLMREQQARVAAAASFSGALEVSVAEDTIGGVDQAFPHAESVVSAAIAERDGECIDTSIVQQTPPIGYVPGLLSYREGGAAIAAVDGLTVGLDVLLVDGNGRIHPRQAGLATHIGVVLDVPTIGVAKSLLCGVPVDPIDELDAGDRVAITAGHDIDADAETVVGYAVQTRQYDAPDRHINPLIVSPGHRISAEAATDIVLATADRYKVPTPLRRADRLAGEATADPKDNDVSG